MVRAVIGWIIHFGDDEACRKAGGGRGGRKFAETYGGKVNQRPPRDAADSLIAVENSARRRKINISGFVNGDTDSPPRVVFLWILKNPTRHGLIREIRFVEFARATRDALSRVNKEGRAEVIISNLTASAFFPLRFIRREPRDDYATVFQPAEMKRKWKNGGKKRKIGLDVCFWGCVHKKK